MEAFKRIAVIGDYLPRRCGIATFTSDLCEAIAAQYPEASCFAVPVNDTEEGYPYPARVRFEMAERDLESYRRAADFLNITNVDLVCLQHECGLFGGTASRLFDLALPEIVKTTSPRAWAFALFGIREYLKRFTGDRTMQNARDELVQRCRPHRSWRA